MEFSEILQIEKSEDVSFKNAARIAAILNSDMLKKYKEDIITIIKKYDRYLPQEV